MRHTTRIYALLGFVLATLTVFGTAAQSNDGGYRIAVQLNDSFAIYAVNQNAEATLIRDFGDQFGFLLSQRATDWIVLTQDDVVPSPDGRYLAFVAGKIPETEHSLFIYDIRTNDLQQVPLAGYALPLWSPDSTALALIMKIWFVDFQREPLLNIYDLATGALNPVAPVEKLVYPAIWAPDSQSLLFVNDSPDCSQPCMDAPSDWYRVDRSGSNLTRLTNLGTEIIGTSVAAQSICVPRDSDWTESGTQLYYSVDCLNSSTGNNQVLVYALDLSGANSLELDVQAEYPEDFHSYSKGIHSLQSGVYVAVSSTIQTYDFATSGNEWRIFNFIPQGNWIIFYQSRFPIDITIPLSFFEVSPDESELVIGGENSTLDTELAHLSIVDTSGQIPAQTIEIDQRICDATWLSNDSLMLSQYSLDGCGPYSEVITQLVRDMDTGAISPLTSSAGPIWIVGETIEEPPMIGPTSTPSPTSTVPAPGCTSYLSDAASVSSAIISANTDAVASTICLESGSTITLVSDPVSFYGPTGLPPITSPITIIGAPGSVIERDPSAEPFRLFAVGDGGSLTLQDVTLRNGLIDENAGAALLVVGADAEANLVNVRLENNQAIHPTEGTGGAVYNYFGSVTITDSRFTGNQAAVTGGALWNWGGSVTVSNSCLVGNGSSAGLAVANFEADPINLENNWWGAVNGPGGVGSGIGDGVGAGVLYEPFLSVPLAVCADLPLTPVPTATETLTPTWTPTATGTLLPPTETETPQETATPTETATQTPTEQVTEIPTATFTPTLTPTPSATPGSGSGLSTGILDDFNRADGSVGSNWGASLGDYGILGEQLHSDSGFLSGYLLWQTAFGATQEASLTFSTTGTPSDTVLLLKAQSGTGVENGALEAWYQPANGVIELRTYSPDSPYTTPRGVPIPVTFQPGDNFRVRALADGIVQLFRNDVMIGSRDIRAWSLYAATGYIGVWTAGEVDNFGGGTLNLTTQQVTAQVAAGSDDVNEEGEYYWDGTGRVWIGGGSDPTASYAGLRFSGIAIPQGATIVSARLEFYVPVDNWIYLEMDIGAEASDNSLTFSETARPSLRSLTNNRAAHSSDDYWPEDTWNMLEDVAPVVQEIVNRSGWQSGNSLSLILRNTSSGAWARKFPMSYEGDPALAPRLIISYVMPGG